jgi:exodeoxyribonuclease VII large subunit
MSKSAEPSPRRPFDPRGVPLPDPQPGLFSASGKQTLSVITVSQLNRLVQAAIRKDLPGDIHVVGELSNVSQPDGGHVYFTLKDDQSEVRCVMWRSSAKSLRFRPTDGLQVVATGHIEVYEPRGQYQLYVRALEPRGVGGLELAFRQLKEKLQKEGLFDPRSKRPLPKFPRRIAVVTSTAGAAVRDILRTIAKRCPAVQVFVFGVRVQGQGAAEEIADAVRRLNAASADLGGIDVMIVGRGGGSLEDLWAFNEEVVARAIHASVIPVVSAVGHEVDFTIADFVADVRAATPTAAAALVVPDRIELLDDLETRRHRLLRAEMRLIEAAKSRLAMAQRCEWFRDPVSRIRHRQQAVDEVLARLQLAARRSFSGRAEAVHRLELRLAGCRPEAVLARLRERASRMEHSLVQALERSLLRRERAVRDAAARLLAASPARRLEGHDKLLKQWSDRLNHGLDRAWADRARDVGVLEARLSASSHNRILRRGFTITRRAGDGKIVTTPRAVDVGDRIETETADGRIRSRVLDQNQDELFD